MATERKVEVRFSVDRIQFEQAGSKVCLCGNSHQEAAMSAWKDYFYAHPGVDGEIERGNDHHRHECLVCESWREAGEWECRTWWPHGEKLVCSYDDSPDAPADVVTAWQAAEEVERAAWEAAWAAADADCGTTDADRAEDEQARYWLDAMGRENRESERAAVVAARIALLPPDQVALARAIVAHVAGKSRSTRKRAWRNLRAAIGADATAELQAVITGFVRRN